MLVLHTGDINLARMGIGGNYSHRQKRESVEQKKEAAVTDYDPVSKIKLLYVLYMLYNQICFITRVDGLFCIVVKTLV